jgi:tetratricopeptide (TPR) repeat protein
MTRTAHELTRKDMKGPDRFQAAAGKAAGWMAGHEKQIAIGVASAVAVLAVGVGVRAWLDSRAEKAAGLLYRVLDDADAEISSVPLPGVNRPVFGTAEEQQRAVVASAAEVRRRYPSSEAARTAALASGDAHLKLAEWDAALADYEEYLRSAPADDALRFAALEGVARAQEGKGELERAAQSYERLAGEAPFYRDRAALERARVLAKAGKADEAKSLLAAFPEQFKESPLRPEAQQRLVRMGGK